MNKDINGKLTQRSPRKTKDWGALPKLNKDPMSDEQYVRRLKMANYGKWYLQPENFKKKVELINLCKREEHFWLILTLTDQFNQRWEY